MASSKLLELSFSFLGFHRRTSLVAFSLPLLPDSLRGSPVARFNGRQFSASSAAFFEGAAAPSAAHPWPEWDLFVEKIRTKGYFEVSSSHVADDGEGTTAANPLIGGGKGATMDLNKLKNACLKFARDRFDILRHLPKEDIRAVVDCGCPNLLRKAVNSAKRLRAFLRLDEAEVCSACNLRESCDRAYLVLHEEGGARTVDLMRILLNYAVNPIALLGEENPPVKVPVQESARKLLSEFIKLSDTAIDPALAKPVLNFSSPKEPSSTSNATLSNKNSRNVEMKKGDWLCPNCNFLNFARNVRCLECKEFRPKPVDRIDVEMKLGDWTCPKCNFMNFARNRKCFACMELRPKRVLNPGEWECPKCDFVNFSRNEVCRKCNEERPSDVGSASKDHIWRKPRKKVKDLMFGDNEEDEEEEDVLRLRLGKKT
ncbi:Zinc finger protein VAR3, chloroplastic [Apostasia shenzhenica]|uniref:Zinc finger protein VAR3, chloroplastic n=1 Tax=Apostasia shenzhenica TaxID=1088818 RepID=A0A2I0B331_9ASPA|nr:Zinc finger protein VAR3, chloroplastic [Apostasia shenzhenica]